MTSVNIHEAKTQLSRLLQRVEAGEEVVIARSGKPVARLVPYTVSRQARAPGSMKGQVLWLAEDFDQLPEDLLRLFEGEEDRSSLSSVGE